MNANLGQIRKTPIVAGEQIRKLLLDMNNSSHITRDKGIKSFREYISLYKPEVPFFHKFHINLSDHFLGL